MLTTNEPVKDLGISDFNLETYISLYPTFCKFLRQEIIYIPSFAAGAKAKVAIWFPWYLESATLNPNVSKIENGFLYNNLGSLVQYPSNWVFRLFLRFLVCGHCFLLFCYNFSYLCFLLYFS